MINKNVKKLVSLSLQKSCIFYFLQITQDINKVKRGIQGLQAFPFCIVTVNDEHAKPRFNRKALCFSSKRKTPKCPNLGIGK